MRIMFDITFQNERNDLQSSVIEYYDNNPIPVIGRVNSRRNYVVNDCGDAVSSWDLGCVLVCPLTPLLLRSCTPQVTQCNIPYKFDEENSTTFFKWHHEEERKLEVFNWITTYVQCD